MIQSNPPAPAETPRVTCSDPCPRDFRVSSRVSSASLVEKPVLGLSHPHSEKMFPGIQWEPPVFQFDAIASGQSFCWTLLTNFLRKLRFQWEQCLNDRERSEAVVVLTGFGTIYRHHAE